jgi:hypothetical protein
MELFEEEGMRDGSSCFRGKLDRRKTCFRPHSGDLGISQPWSAPGLKHLVTCEC